MWIDDLKNYEGDVYLNGTYIEDISRIRLDKLIGDNVITLLPKQPEIKYTIEVKHWLTILDSTTRSFHTSYNSGMPAPSRYLVATIEKQDNVGYYVKAKSTRSNRIWYGCIPYDAILRMEEIKNG